MNPDKQVWCCYACAEGGDVIRFVEKLHGVDFQGALRILGIHRDAPPRPTPQSISLDAKARDLAAWSNAMSIRAATKMRRLAREMEHARQSCDLFALVTLRRAWNLLDDIADDVQAQQTAFSNQIKIGRPFGGEHFRPTISATRSLLTTSFRRSLPSIAPRCVHCSRR